MSNTRTTTPSATNAGWPIGHNLSRYKRCVRIAKSPSLRSDPMRGSALEDAALPRIATVTDIFDKPVIQALRPARGRDGGHPLRQGLSRGAVDRPRRTPDRRPV